MRTCSLLVFFLLTTTLTAQAPERWNRMDYGPFLSATVEATWPDDNVALKGLAIRLRNEGGVLFDTELLRVAAMWDGGNFLQLRGTTFDGAHGPIPRIGGRQIQGTAVVPGFQTAAGFSDPRTIPHGPLQKQVGRYRGLHLSGEQVVLHYTVGTTDVYETFGLEDGATPLLTRTLEFGARSQPLVLVVGEAGEASLSKEDDLFLWRAPAPMPTRVHLDRSERSFDELAAGPPVKDDLAQADGAVFRHVEGFTPHRQAGADPTTKILGRLNDGLVARNDDDTERCVWFDGAEGRIHLDLGQRKDVARIHTYAWHRSHRAATDLTIYGSAEANLPVADGADPAADGWTKIADADTRPLGQGGKHTVAIANPDGTLLGSFRHLLFVSRSKAGDGTFFTEIDVFGKDHPRTLRRPMPPRTRVAGLVKASGGVRLQDAGGGRLVLHVPAGHAGLRAKIAIAAVPEESLKTLRTAIMQSPSGEDVVALTRKDKPRWLPELETRGIRAKDDAAYVVDTITVPDDNPWHSWMRIGAFDFFRDGRAAVSTWSGDVWIVSGIDDGLQTLKWKRFATGLYDPLGLRIVDGVIHTLGRDGITRLHDRNGDGEADHYQCFNNDVLITRNFHEFQFDLQTDAAGNFYFSKGGPVRSGGRGFDKILAHHGTILRVSKDGEKLDVYATGFRAPNGIGISPTGQLTSGDNEGTWMPTCRLNWIKEGGFHGCVDTAQQDPRPATYDPPLAWLPMNVDNSSGGQVWVTSKRFGPFENRMLHLSYGQCALYSVMTQEVDRVMQGALVRFPLSFASSLMRGRFHDRDGQLYVVGFKGWQTRAARETAFQRVRYTGKAVHMPTSVKVVGNGLEITFTDPLDAESTQDPQNWAVTMWNYDWSQRYGSPEVSVRNPLADQDLAQTNISVRQHDDVEVKAVTLSKDNRTVLLELVDMVPCMTMKVALNVDALDGSLVKHDIHLTIHNIPKE